MCLNSLPPIVPAEKLEAFINGQWLKYEGCYAGLLTDARKIFDREKWRYLGFSRRWRINGVERNDPRQVVHFFIKNLTVPDSQVQFTGEAHKRTPRFQVLR